MKLGRLFGILAIFCGSIFTYIGYGMMESTGSVFKFLIAAPVLSLLESQCYFSPEETSQPLKAKIRQKILRSG